MTFINDIRIKDHNVHNFPENRELLGYARKNRKSRNDVLQLVNIVLSDLRKYIIGNYEHEGSE